MLQEVGKFILEEAVGASLGGLIRRARSRKAHRLKVAAWLCLIALIVFSWRPHGGRTQLTVCSIMRIQT